MRALDYPLMLQFIGVGVAILVAFTALFPTVVPISRDYTGLLSYQADSTTSGNVTSTTLYVTASAPSRLNLALGNETPAGIFLLGSGSLVNLTITNSSLGRSETTYWNGSAASVDATPSPTDIEAGNVTFTLAFNGGTRPVSGKLLEGGVYPWPWLQVRGVGGWPVDASLQINARPSSWISLRVLGPTVSFYQIFPPVSCFICNASEVPTTRTFSGVTYINASRFTRMNSMYEVLNQGLELIGYEAFFESYHLRLDDVFGEVKSSDGVVKSTPEGTSLEAVGDNLTVSPVVSSQLGTQFRLLLDFKSSWIWDLSTQQYLDHADYGNLIVQAGAPVAVSALSFVSYLLQRGSSKKHGR